MPGTTLRPLTIEKEDSMQAKLLVVDDEEMICDLVAQNLAPYDYGIDRAHSVQEAIALLRKTDYDIVIADKNMPASDDGEEGGMSLLRYVKRNLPNTEVIMMTGYATIETAVEAMKLGAFDYLVKPFAISELKEKIDRIMDYKNFITSENTVQIYKTLHIELLSLLQNRDNLPDDELHELLKAVGKRIDHVFGAQKEWEKIIRIQSENLHNIAAWAEQLKELIPQSDPAYRLVERISAESKKRI